MSEVVVYADDETESEKLVQASFDRIAKGRTTVAVAHRLATIQNADIIYVLGEGKVLEKGSHSELLRQKGVYYHMVCCLLSSLSLWVEWLGLTTAQCHNQALDR